MHGVETLLMTDKAESEGKTVEVVATKLQQWLQVVVSHLVYMSW